MAISSEIIYGHDFADEAELLRADWGQTNLFSTGVPELDLYLGGGFGRRNGYEIVLIFGPTKAGKSTLALNFAADAIRKGQRVGVFHLEDDGPDVFLRLCRIVGKEAAERYVLKGTTVHFLGAVSKMWKLTDLIDLLESWYVDRELDLIIIDPLQFAFENAESLRGENEWTSQRVFMRALNALMRRLKKTVILVSHINQKDGSAKGVAKITGSGGIAAACTKLLEFSKDGRVLQLREWGSRFTFTPEEPHQIMLENLRLKEWNGK